MSGLSFGDPEFRISCSDIVVLEQTPALSQFKIVISGVGWSLQADDIQETLGVVVERLAGFLSNAAARHWGAFVGATSEEAVVDRVSEWGYGRGDRSGTPGFHRWAKSSALIQYSLSSCFDYNLGVDQAVAVRYGTNETLIWRTGGGDVRSVTVPTAQFDKAMTGFVKWGQELQASGS